MFQFLTFQTYRGFRPGHEPDVPGLGQITCHEAYAQLQSNLKATFAAELRQEREGFSLEFSVAGMATFMLNIQTFRQTACLVRVGLQDGSRTAKKNAGRFLGSWLLLTGFPDADEALLDALRDPDHDSEGPGHGDWARFPAIQLDVMHTVPKPVVMQLMAKALYEPPERMYLFLIACEAFGQAFFDQFGASRANELPAPPAAP